MKRQFFQFEATTDAEGVGDEDDEMATEYASQQCYNVTQQQDAEQQPAPLPMFKRLRITSQHECGSMRSIAVDLRQQSLMYPQEHSSWSQQSQQSEATIASSVNHETQYTNINQVLGSLHRERKNRLQFYNNNINESDEGNLIDHVDHPKYSSNQEYSDTNSVSSLSSCTTAQQAAAHGMIDVPATYQPPSLLRKKLYTDSRLL